MYEYWPTGDAVALQELEQVLLAPLYAAAADSPLFLATPRELEEERAPPKKMRKLEDGLVLHGVLSMEDIPSSLGLHANSPKWFKPTGFQPMVPNSPD